MRMTRITKREIDTKNMNYDDWLEQRKYSLGGSDAGTILGFNKYKSPYTLYWEKLEPEMKEDLSNNEAIHFGNVLEDVVAREFTRRTGKKVRKHNKMMFHDDYDFLSANVDRVVVGEKAILECKTANQFKEKEWKDDNVPASYMAQCYHYLAVTGYKRAYIAVLIGGQTFHWTVIERDDEVIEQIIESEKDFWYNHIQAQIPPDVDGSASTESTLNKLWHETQPTSMTIEEEQSARFRAVMSIKQQIKDLRAEQREHENKIKELLGENEEGATTNYRATWKRQSSKRIDTKRLKEEQPEIYNAYIKESNSRPLKISEVE